MKRQNGDYMKKKFLTLLTAIVLSITMVTSSFASEIPEDIIPGDASGTFEMITNNPENNDTGISLYQTFYGSGGACSLDYMSSNRSIAWRVTPATKQFFTFVGEITIRNGSTNNYLTSYSVSGSGTGSVSGVTPRIKGMVNGQIYKAVFTGEAMDLSGNIYLVTAGAVLFYSI